MKYVIVVMEKYLLVLFVVVKFKHQTLEITNKDTKLSTGRQRCILLAFFILIFLGWGVREKHMCRPGGPRAQGVKQIQFLCTRGIVNFSCLSTISKQSHGLTLQRPNKNKLTLDGFSKWSVTGFISY